MAVSSLAGLDRGAALRGLFHPSPSSRAGQTLHFLPGETTSSRGFAVGLLQQTGLDAAPGLADVQGRLEGFVKGRTRPQEYFGLFRNGDRKAHFAAADGTARLALAALAANATTLGIPCVYYGSEQAFDGAGGRIESVVAWSRILSGREVVCALNTDTARTVPAWVAVDAGLHAGGTGFVHRYASGGALVGMGTAVAAEARNGLAIRLTLPPAGFAILVPTQPQRQGANMSHPHRPAREPEPTEAFGGTAPMEVEQYPGSEAAADEHPEDAPGTESAVVPPRSMEDIPHVTVAELLRRQHEPGR